MQSPTDKIEELYFMEEEVGRGWFEPKSVGEKQHFMVMTISHWLSCRDNQFLVGDAVCIFPSGAYKWGFFPLRCSARGLWLIVLWVVDIEWCGCPFYPPFWVCFSGISFNSCLQLRLSVHYSLYIMRRPSHIFLQKDHSNLCPSVTGDWFSGNYGVLLVDLVHTCSLSPSVVRVYTDSFLLFFEVG